MKAIADVARDFDHIAAALADEPPNRRLTAAEAAAVDAIPAGARTVLDVGCGDGRLSRVIAGRGPAVTAIDVSPQMIALAHARTTDEVSITYRVADVMHTDALAQEYDAVISVNVVHHLPLMQIVPRLASLVAPGGVLVIQDVVTRDGLRYLLLNVVAGLWTRATRLLRLARTSRRVRWLYDQHGRDETYLAPRAVRDALAAYLPGVRVRHHLGWRYTAVWSRAAAP